MFPLSLHTDSTICLQCCSTLTYSALDAVTVLLLKRGHFSRMLTHLSRTTLCSNVVAHVVEELVPKSEPNNIAGTTVVTHDNLNCFLCALGIVHGMGIGQIIDTQVARHTSEKWVFWAGLGWPRFFGQGLVDPGDRKPQPKQPKSNDCHARTLKL